MSSRFEILRRAGAVGCCLLLSLPVGCALTSKAEVITPRYFSPEPVRTAHSPKSTGRLELRLGQVSAASHLDERMAYRVGGSEMGFYDDQRWTENPEAYLRRALERDLYEERGLSRIVAGDAPILDVELTAFEELRGQPSKARVAISFGLRDDRRAFVERTLELERPLEQRAGADTAQLRAEALTRTLDEAVRKIGDEVVESLRSVQPAAVIPNGSADR